ncbi:hypothetical protein PQX77_013250 [Marasmius sp. AFHP31]|nr:hypothetical protein PQX77_013250 [Marasmius sp. AFHP31]
MGYALQANNDTRNSLVAVMGSTGTGKSTFINLASGGRLGVGESLYSCTDKVGLAPPFILNGRHVTLIDTPGFDDTKKNDTEILKLITAFLSETYRAGQQLSGIIYLHRITDVRMGGTAARNFRLFRKLCGEESLRNVVIVTNRWEEVDLNRGEARERELMTEEQFFKPALDEGAQMVRHNNTPQVARSILSHLIQNKPIPLRIQVEVVDEHKNFEETEAGVEFNGVLEELKKKHQEEMAQLRKEFEEARAERDVKAQRELDATRREMQKEMDRIKGEAQKMTTGLKDQIRQLGEDLVAARTTSKEQVDRLEEQIRDLEQSSGSSLTEIASLKTELKAAKQRTELMSGCTDDGGSSCGGGGGGCVVM